MKHGGKRPGAGIKPGQKKEKLKPDILKRRRKQFSLPEYVCQHIETEKKNQSQYVLELILADNPDLKPPK